MSESHDTKITNARNWLNQPDGRKELLKKISEDLLVNLQLESEEGRDLGDSAAGRMAARQARKQYKETAEMVIQITAALDKEIQR